MFVCTLVRCTSAACQKRAESFGVFVTTTHVHIKRFSSGQYAAAYEYAGPWAAINPKDDCANFWATGPWVEKTPGKYERLVYGAAPLYVSIQRGSYGAWRIQVQADAKTNPVLLNQPASDYSEGAIKLYRFLDLGEVLQENYRMR